MFSSTLSLSLWKGILRTVQDYREQHFKDIHMVNVLIYWCLLWAVELNNAATWPRHGIMAPQKTTKTSGKGALDKLPVDNNSDI